MTPKDFFNGTKLNQLNTELEAFLRADTWDEPREILVHETSFEHLDRFSPGRNGVSDVVQLTTRTIDTSSVYFDKTGRYGFTSLYVKATTRGGHGFGEHDGALLIVYRDSKGKRASIEIASAWNKEEIEVDGLFHVLCDSVCKGLKHFSPAWTSRRERLKKRLQYEIKIGTDTDRGQLSKVIVGMFARAGKPVIKVVPFTHRFNCLESQTRYVKRSKGRIEIGLKNVSTYCSLPSVIVIEMRKSRAKLVRMSEAGIEGPGYYDHSERLKIRPEHVKAAKAFNARFNANAGGAK